MCLIGYNFAAKIGIKNKVISLFVCCVWQVDISCPQQVKSLHRKLQLLPSVGGIVLTAMVLRDELISSLDMGNFQTVIAPKVKGRKLAPSCSFHAILNYDKRASFKRVCMGISMSEC